MTAFICFVLGVGCGLWIANYELRRVRSNVVIDNARRYDFVQKGEL